MLDSYGDVSYKVGKLVDSEQLGVGSESEQSLAWQLPTLSRDSGHAKPVYECETRGRGVNGEHHKKRVVCFKIDICHLSLAGSAEIRGNPVQHCHRLVRQSDIGDCYWLSLFHRRLNDKSIGLR
jgi:hypothetical protein